MVENEYGHFKATDALIYADFSLIILEFFVGENPRKSVHLWLIHVYLDLWKRKRHPYRARN